MKWTPRFGTAPQARRAMSESEASSGVRRGQGIAAAAGKTSASFRCWPPTAAQPLIERPFSLATRPNRLHNRASSILDMDSRPTSFPGKGENGKGKSIIYRSFDPTIRRFCQIEPRSLQIKPQHNRLQNSLDCKVGGGKIQICLLPPGSIPREAAQQRH